MPAIIEVHFPWWYGGFSMKCEGAHDENEAVYDIAN